MISPRRREFLALIDAIVAGEVKTVIVAHKDSNAREPTTSNA